MMRSIFEKLFVIAVTILLCLMILEIGLRILGRNPSNMTDGIFEQFDDSYRLKKNITKVTKWPTLTYIVHTNSLGLRDNGTCKKDINGKPYLVFLGDSIVFANGVNYEDSFVGVFEELASNEYNGLNVLNLGTGGHRLNDQENLFKELTINNSSKPTVAFMCVNSIFLHNFDKRYKDIFVKNGYLFDKKAWKIAFIKIIVSNMSSSYCFFRDNLRKIQTMWKKTETDDADSVLQIYAKNNRFKDSLTIDKLEEDLAEWEMYCHSINTKPVYVYIPNSNELYLDRIIVESGKKLSDYDISFYERLIESYCKKRNIQFINLRPTLEKYYHEGKQLNFSIDLHYNEFANRIIGEYIYENYLST